jgi:hypothetical protein
VQRHRLTHDLDLPREPAVDREYGVRTNLGAHGIGPRNDRQLVVAKAAGLTVVDIKRRVRRERS